MKNKLLTLLFALLALPALADEGMWLPSLISERIGDMRAKGFRLTAEDIYSINNDASMKNAVVLFANGCTAELISDEGLLLTNHHCGYDAIQSHSTVEHDYLTHGFWARSREEELPNKDLDVKFLVRMEEITDRVAGGETREEIIARAEKEGVNYKACIEQMYYGNQLFLFVYEQFDDVRLVAAPPSSIGKFGGDTDNWIWPRHTGDFSMFRIYAGKDNKPAAYSSDNVPYRPKRHFAISTRGVKEGDFTMIYGFPGNTQEYITSDAVEYIVNISDPQKIDIRTGRLDIIAKGQASDPALRIHYAAKHAGIANAWKKWQGEVLGLKRNNIVERKRRYEEEFRQWAETRPEYNTVLKQLHEEYEVIREPYFAREMMYETLYALPKGYSEEERAEEVFAKRHDTEQALFVYLFTQYDLRCPESFKISEFVDGVRTYGSVEKYALAMFDAVWKGEKSERLEEYTQLKESMVRMQKYIQDRLETKQLRNLSSKRMNELYTVYIRGLREWDTRRAFFPDANLTLRVAYGSVMGYEYADGEYHKPQTTLDGIIAKDNPEIYDYDIPESLREIYRTKDYGRWGAEINGHHTVPVCFLATNQTTGGNSGSPIINADGELVGLNFDRTWLSTMSDIAFDPSICRNISVDIRYVLMVIEKVGGASYLFDEMTLR